MHFLKRTVRWTLSLTLHFIENSMWAIVDAFLSSAFTCTCPKLGSVSNTAALTQRWPKASSCLLGSCDISCRINCSSSSFCHHAGLTLQCKRFWAWNSGIILAISFIRVDFPDLKICAAGASSRASLFEATSHAGRYADGRPRKFSHVFFQRTNELQRWASLRLISAFSLSSSVKMKSL